MLLDGKVALVAGATRGAGRGIAVELGAAGATVYVTGRSTPGQPSDYGRPETIEETAALVTDNGGQGIPVRVDHLVPSEVEASWWPASGVHCRAFSQTVSMPPGVWLPPQKSSPISGCQ